jgi:hypothetical protein
LVAELIRNRDGGLRFGPSLRQTGRATAVSDAVQRGSPARRQDQMRLPSRNALSSRARRPRPRDAAVAERALGLARQQAVGRSPSSTTPARPSTALESPGGRVGA